MRYLPAIICALVLGAALLVGYITAPDRPKPAGALDVDKKSQVLIIDTNDVAEVQKMFAQASTTLKLYVGVYTDVSAEVKAEVKKHSEITEGFWLYRNKVKKANEEKHLDAIVKEASGKSPVEIKKKSI